MKILHLIYSLQVAGAEKYLVDLLPGLKQQGIDVELICVTTKHDQHKFISYLQNFELGKVKTTLFISNKYNLLSTAKRISKYIKDNRIDCIHSHLFKADIFAVLIRRFYNKEIFLISTKHGYREKYLTRFHVHKGEIVHDLYYYLSRFVNRNIHVHVTISKAMAELYYQLKLSRERIKYIHHGIQVKGLQNYSKSLTKVDKPQLIIVGRIEEMKGHRYLLEAMPTLIKSYPSLRLLIIGEGSLKEPLKRLANKLKISKNIKFLGFKDSPYPFIAESDIIVLPSLFEPFGIVYIEAFALRIPVVAFDVAATNEIIDNNSTGILVEAKNSIALAEKIIFLLQNPEEKERLVKNAYETYLGHFNTDRMVKETADWYKNILSF